MRHLMRHPPFSVAHEYDGTALTPEAEIVDPSRSGRGRRFLFRLVDLVHDGVEAATAFDGVPIGISEGLPEPRRFRSRSWISGCPGLARTLRAVEMLLVPLTGSTV